MDSDRPAPAPCVVLFANTPWYLLNFRIGLAERLRALGWRVLLVSPEGEHGAALERLGFEWRPAPMQRRSLSPLAQLRLVVWLARLLRRERVSLVHGFTLKCALLGALAARFAGSVPAVCAITGLGYVFSSEDGRARVLRRAAAPVLRAVLAGSNIRIVCQNSADRAIIARLVRVPAGRIYLIAGSGVDLSRFRPAEGVNAGEDGSGVSVEASPVRVLMAARLLVDKGVLDYLAAVRRLAPRFPNVEFLLAGAPDAGNPGSLPPDALGADRELIRWLGQVDDMPALLRTVQVFVLPSYREGLSKALIEAAACGIALVTTDVPGCRDVVEHEQSGLLVPVRDPDALSGAIERLIAQPGLRWRLGLAARRDVRRFDERHIIQETLSVYADALGFSSGRGTVIPSRGNMQLSKAATGASLTARAPGREHS